MPAIVHWPGVAKAGGVSEEPVITVDFFPTILEAAGQTVSKTVDGSSLVPLIKDPKTVSLNRDAIFWHYPHYHMMGGIPHSTVRMGDWKLIERHGGAPLELYHLAKDIHEDRNLAGSEPERAAAMHQRLKSWRKSVGAQMPVKNPDYDPGLPTGWKRGEKWRVMSVVREP